MEVTVLDERSRITLGKAMQKRYGKRFMIVPTPSEIILMPISSADPVKRLEAIGQKYHLEKYSLKQLKKMALEEGEKEAMAGINP